MEQNERLLTGAIVRPPADNFANGLTTVDLGSPDYAKTLKQHNAYCAALQACGLTLAKLPPDNQHPDSTFVEDTAVLTPYCAVVTRPGAESRRGETAEIAGTLAESFTDIRAIRAPATLDGGDVCEAGNHFFIGISSRTNEAGAKQLSGILASLNYTSEIIDIRKVKSILHLKSGLAHLGDKRLVVIDELLNLSKIQGYELIGVNQGDEYAANCVRINEAVLIAAGFPQFAQRLQERGYRTIALEMSEFQKMDGGLSCLSLRF